MMVATCHLYVNRMKGAKHQERSVHDPSLTILRAAETTDFVQGHGQALAPA